MSGVTYRHLTERGIPFLVYSGFTVDDGVPSGAPFLQKPAVPGVLVAAMEELIRANPRTLRSEAEPGQRPV